MAIRLVTFTKSKQTGDRSFCEDIFQIVSENESHYRIKAMTGFWKDRKCPILMKKERDVFDATPLITEDEKKSFLCRATLT